MTQLPNLHTAGDSAVWIENLVNGLSGITIKAKHSVYCEASPFQKIEVYDTYSYGRILILAGTIVLTERDEYIYSEMIAHPALLSHPKPASVCIIGGGDGAALREVLKHREVKNVTVVEIDELVIGAVKRLFEPLSKGFSDPRVRVVINDGNTFMQGCADSFDVILVDAYDPGGPVQSLSTTDFFHLVSRHLRPDGIAVFQTDSPVVRGEAIRHTLLNVKPLFPIVKSYLCSIPSFPEGTCSFVLCAKSAEQKLTVEAARAAAMGAQCRYYNAEVHTGAFLLPQNVRIVVNG